MGTEIMLFNLTKTKSGLMGFTFLLSSTSNFALAQSSQATAQSGYLDEIVVTAQKREQNVQDIGIAITALGGDTLADKGIKSVADLHKIVPNVSVRDQAGVPVVMIRGVGLQNFRINDSPTTAIYLDGVYQTSVVSAGFALFDIDRVEILKGPQGGLYGRNSIAGSLQVVSKYADPNDNVNGYGRVTYGSYQNRQVEGAIGLPLGDTLAARFAGRYEKSGDTQYTSVAGGFDHGEIDRWAARGTLRFLPTHNLDIRLKVDGGRDNSETALLRPVPIHANLGITAGVATSILTQTLCPSVLAGQGVSADCVFTNGLTAAASGLDLSDDGRFTSNSGARSFIDIKNIGIDLTADLDLGDFTLTSISALRDIDYRRFIDGDGQLTKITHVDYVSELKSWSQEARLAYTGGDRLTAVFGVNYAEDELLEDTLLEGPDGLLPLAFNGGIASQQVYQQNTEAFAVYSHGEYRLVEPLNLVGELRYANVKKTFVGGQSVIFPGAEFPFLSADNEITFNNVSGKVALEYSTSDDVLLYASVSRGFKSGGFFGGFVTNAAGLNPFNEETLWAYEAGFKGDFLDSQLRVNGSAFYYDRSDVQQSATDTSGVVSVTRLTNIGDVEVYGVELDVIYAPTSSLLFQAGFGFTDSSVVSSTFISSTLNGVAPSSIVGTNTPSYAKYNVNLLGQYEWDVSSSLLARFQAAYTYRSSRDLSLITNEAIEGPVLRDPGYSLVDLALEFGDQDESWKFRFFVDNVTDSVYRTRNSGDGLRGRYELFGDPRTWGVALSLNF